MSGMPDKNSETIHFHNTVSKNALSVWGIENVSYVKSTLINEELVWAVYGAEGTLITVAPNRDTAFAIIKQFDLEPMSAH